MTAPSEFYDDPVEAYDRTAPIYAKLAEQRQAYLSSINSLIAERVPSGSHSLLDVGAGNGKRALRIAQMASLNEIVLIEPSRTMRKGSTDKTEVYALRAEELDHARSPLAGRHFDVIMSLWNVLGHIKPEKSRVRVLHQLSRALSPTGLLFLDVNHRYNAKAYGWAKTMVRWMGDCIAFTEHSGDVVASWTVGDKRCSTYGHVFTAREIGRLASEAGLAVRERLVVDYQSGDLRPFGFLGNLLYVFRPASARTSLRLAQTSLTSASVS